MATYLTTNELRQGSAGFFLTLDFELLGYTGTYVDETWRVRIVTPDGTVISKTTDVESLEPNKISVPIVDFDLLLAGKYYYQVTLTTGGANVNSTVSSFTIEGSLPENLDYTPISSSFGYFPIFSSGGSLAQSALHVDEDNMLVWDSGGAIFNDVVTVPYQAYSSGWATLNEVPTKQAVYEAIQSAVAGLSIGAPVIGGSAGSVLFINNSGNLAQDNNKFNYNSTTGALKLVDKNYVPYAGALNADVLFSVASNDNIQNNAGLISTTNHFVGSTTDLKIFASGSGKWYIGNFIQLRVTGDYVGSGQMIGQWVSLNNRGNLAAVPYMYGVDVSINTEGHAVESVGIRTSAYRGSAINCNTFVGIRATGANGYVNAVDVTGGEFFCRTVSAGATISYGRSVWAKLQTTFGHTVTEARGVSVDSWINGGTLVNTYGIYIDTSVDVGTTTRYAIYSLATSPSLLTGKLIVPDDAYSSAWDGDMSVPTKNAIYDAFISAGGGLTVGSSPISGTDNRVLYQSSGVLQQSSNLQFNGTNLGIGGAGSYPLDVTGNARITDTLGIGRAPASNLGLAISKTFSANGVQGINLVVNQTGAGGNFTTRGIDAQITYSGAGINTGAVVAGYMFASNTSGATNTALYGLLGGATNSAGATTTTLSGLSFDTINSGTTSTAVSIDTKVYNVGASANLTSAYGIRSALINFTSGASIGTYKAIAFEGWNASTVGTILNNNYLIYADATVNVGTNKYAFFIIPDMPSYHVGKFGIGQDVVSPTARLQVRDSAEQLRLENNENNYLRVVVDYVGSTYFTAFTSDPTTPSIVFNNPVIINGYGLTAKTTTGQHMRLEYDVSHYMVAQLASSGTVAFYLVGDSDRKFIFANPVQVPTDAYDEATWNGNSTVPTKDAIRDKFESLTFGMSIGDTVGSATAKSVLYAGASGVLSQDNAAFAYDESTDTLKLGDTSYLGNTVGASSGWANTQAFLKMGFDTAYLNNTQPVYGAQFDMKRSQTGGSGQQTSGIRPRAWIQDTGSSGYGIATAVEAFVDNTGSTVTTTSLQAIEGITQVAAAGLWAVGGWFQVNAQANLSFAGWAVRAIIGQSAGTTGTSVVYETILNTSGSGAITNGYGIRMAGWSGSGISNSYGLYMDTSIDRGTVSKWAIYSLSTSPSLFSGVVRVPDDVQNIGSPSWVSNVEVPTKNAVDRLNNIDRQVTFFNDCNYSSGIEQDIEITNTVAGVWTTASTHNYTGFGLINLNMTTNSAAKGSVSRNNSVGTNMWAFRLSTGKATVVYRGAIEVLSDGTNTYTMRIGLMDLNQAAPTNGCFFRYTHSVNSGKWEAVCVDNGTETAQDTGITAGIGVMDKFMVVVNAAGTEATFYINGTLTNTITTNIPTANNRLVGEGMTWIKSAGTTNMVALTVDYLWSRYEFTTSR